MQQSKSNSGSANGKRLCSMCYKRKKEQENNEQMLISAIQNAAIFKLKQTDGDSDGKSERLTKASLSSLSFDQNGDDEYMQFKYQVIPAKVKKADRSVNFEFDELFEEDCLEGVEPRPNSQKDGMGATL